MGAAKTADELPRGRRGRLCPLLGSLNKRRLAVRADAHRGRDRPRKHPRARITALRALGARPRAMRTYHPPVRIRCVEMRDFFETESKVLAAVAIPAHPQRAIREIRVSRLAD